jgi:hypothetical protein
LEQILQSQAFYQFIEASVFNCGWSDPGLTYLHTLSLSLSLSLISLLYSLCSIDILFFDESIEAYLNRSSFLSFMKTDTPFLLDDSEKHAKTIVVPSPIETFDDVMDEILNPSDPLVAATQFISKDKTGRELFRYQNFPKLK